MAQETKPGRRIVCKNLRCKEMYYSPNALQEDAFHGGSYWCELTHNGRGPDGVWADNEECTPTRSCFQR